MESHLTCRLSCIFCGVCAAALFDSPHLAQHHTNRLLAGAPGGAAIRSAAENCHRRDSFPPLNDQMGPNKKPAPTGAGFLFGGAEGNRTPVRKQLDRTFFGRSLLFTFPCRSGNKHPQRLGRVIMHGRGNSYPPHGHHSDHTLARLVVLPGRMGA